MKRSRYTEQQIAFALRQAETGTSVSEVCRKMGIAEQTYYRWKRKYAGMGVAELRRLKRICQNSELWGKLVSDRVDLMFDFMLNESTFLSDSMAKFGFEL